MDLTGVRCFLNAFQKKKCNVFILEVSGQLKTAVANKLAKNFSSTKTCHFHRIRLQIARAGKLLVKYNKFVFITAFRRVVFARVCIRPNPINLLPAQLLL